MSYLYVVVGPEEQVADGVVHRVIKVRLPRAVTLL